MNIILGRLCSRSATIGSRGRRRFRAFYVKRQQRGPISARHVVSNLQVLPIHERHVRLIGVLSLYYAQGRPPHYGIHPPMLVADITAECVLGADERWRYRSHVLSPLFIGNAMPISLSVELGTPVTIFPPARHR